MIIDGMVPSFYADKLQVDHKTRTPLGLALSILYNDFFKDEYCYNLVVSLGPCQRTDLKLCLCVPTY